MDNKTRLWCFTNYNLEFDYNAYMEGETGCTSAQYVIYGDEVCPTTGRPHHQGFVYFSGARSRGLRAKKQIAKELGKCNVRPCDGNLDQNCDYCSKDNKVHEFGKKPTQGFRTDLQAVSNSILTGELTVDRICAETPNLYHQYGRTLNKLEDLALRRKFRSWMTRGEWYYGKTGTGKSYHAFKDFHPDTHYVYPNDGGWWDGYTGQPNIIINEFRGGIAYAELLDLLDRYPKTVRRRGREPVPFLGRLIIFTSVLTPKEVYNNLAMNDSLDQLYRRIDLFKMEQKWSEGNTGTSDPVKMDPYDVIWDDD